MGSVNRPRATIGILSVGDMGSGIARLLIANDFQVVTNASDRSQATQSRARDSGVLLVSSDVELCNTSDYVMSIVPPSDAIATASRIVTAASDADFKQRPTPLYFLDLNAISPKSARGIDDLIKSAGQAVLFIDGGIIGGPPHCKDDSSWYRPSIPTSGPLRLDEATPAGDKIADVLNVKYVNDTIGAASGLKMCFASLAKGFTGLAVQSFTTAHNLGIVTELRTHMEEFNPNGLKAAERGLPSMCPKAYRWVHEMQQIAETFEEDGGFVADESPFRAIAGIYDFVAHGTKLGKEITGQRHRGKTADDVATLVSEGTAARKVKTE